MKHVFSSPLWRSVGFVALAVAVTVAIASVGGDDGQVRQRTAAIPASAPLPRLKVRDPGVSAQEAADYANGVPGVNGTLYPLKPRVFHQPIATYRQYARRGAVALQRHVDALAVAVRADDRARARRVWAASDSSFTRIGAAYGALGKLGDAIDGGPGGLPNGPRDRHFVGLQRLEMGLWSPAPVHRLIPIAARLRRDVATLRTRLKTSPITPLDYATRAHEILEDAQRDRLDAGRGADAGVRAVADGLAATKVVVHTLTPALSGRGDALNRTRYWLSELGATLASIRRAHAGSYPTVAALSTRELETLNGRLGETLEVLADIPGSLETIKHVPLPKLRG